ncbi:MAG: CatB-related O-acetyltransferase [Pseudomonadaceae bacterium]|nr:CatB-related O-acetyltransferase [Pseudomonadaceae bacterium]
MFSFGYMFNRVVKKLRGVAISKSSVHKKAKIGSGSTVISSAFGKYSYCGYDCLFVNCNVGAFSSIANKVTVGGASHPVHFVSTSPAFISREDSGREVFASLKFDCYSETFIGNDVWIGDGVYIKGGLRIGDGAIIGMGSVVTKDVPPYAVFAGNPAKLIRMRFDENVIAFLLELKWWDLPDESLRQRGFMFDSPRRLIEAGLNE